MKIKLKRRGGMMKVVGEHYSLYLMGYLKIALQDYLEYQNKIIIEKKMKKKFLYSDAGSVLDTRNPLIIKRVAVIGSEVMCGVLVNKVRLLVVSLVRSLRLP